MTHPRLADVPVRTADELTRRWHHLLGEPTFTARSLWLAWLDDGLVLPVVIPVDGVPAVPDRPMLADLAHVCASVTESHVSGAAHLALALCRPGAARIGQDDRRWADGLQAVLDGSWTLHLAAGGRVQPVDGSPSQPWAR